MIMFQLLDSIVNKGYTVSDFRFIKPTGLFRKWKCGTFEICLSKRLSNNLMQEVWVQIKDIKMPLLQMVWWDFENKKECGQ